ncbi:hypothetical protein B0H13DRAFT_401502 [Mycena leptocephala]|nr:hypothetical protein B0H13DRAFT_401502 [Mycena leptocephala]
MTFTDGLCYQFPMLLAITSLLAFFVSATQERLWCPTAHIVSLIYQVSLSAFSISRFLVRQVDFPAREIIENVAGAGNQIIARSVDSSKIKVTNLPGSTIYSFQIISGFGAPNFFNNPNPVVPGSMPFTDTGAALLNLTDIEGGFLYTITVPFSNPPSL